MANQEAPNQIKAIVDSANTNPHVDVQTLMLQYAQELATKTGEPIDTAIFEITSDDLNLSRELSTPTRFSY